jgi:hypothetical protein
MNGFTCPHLGRADDPETAFAFSSPGHRCFRLEMPSPIAESHQTAYCLSDNYTQCPVILLASSLEPDREKGLPAAALEPVQMKYPDQKPLPVPIAIPSPAQTRIRETAAKIQAWIMPLFKAAPGQNPAVPAIFATSLAILIIAMLFFAIVAVSYFSTPQVEVQPTAEIALVPEENQPDIFLITVTPTLRSAFIKKMGQAASAEGLLLAPMPPSSQNNSPDSAVVTPTVQPTSTGYQACGAPANWVPYYVQEGDSLTGLSVTYDVPLGELSSYNCLNMNSNLFIGQQIYVPTK